MTRGTVRSRRTTRNGSPPTSRVTTFRPIWYAYHWSTCICTTLPDPHIFEYDTLTSEERWNEYADVILANPPFMSPKGGIQPHNRFSVRSKRSEVLFVDYMAEHLTPSGRAGIIVPEGIIFQSQTAYKQLRKMLAEEYLVAVVSLPAGVFQPLFGCQDLDPHPRQRYLRRGPTVLRSSRLRTTASTSAPSDVLSTRTTYRKYRLNLLNICARCGRMKP